MEEGSLPQAAKHETREPNTSLKQGKTRKNHKATKQGKKLLYV